MKRRLVLLATLLALSGGLSALGVRSHPPGPWWKPRLVIVLVLDTARADHLGCYGYPRPTSPNIDRVAANGVVFENVFSQSNTSLFSSLSLMTGHYPERFGALDFSTFHLPDQEATIASTLRSYGFRTAGFVAGGHWRQSFGLGHGFESYQDGNDFGSLHETFPTAMQWLDALPSDSSAFMLLHGYDLHSPCVKPLFFRHMFDPGYRGIADDIARLPDGTEDIWGGQYFTERPVLSSLQESRGQSVLPGAYYDLLEQMKKDGAPHITLSEADVRHFGALYDAAIRYADVYVGLLIARLRELGIDRQTLLVLIGDHGEGLGRHGYFGHQSYLLDGQLHVPFILWGPGGIPAGRRVSQVSQLVDLAPTLYDYALRSIPSGGSRPPLDGRSLRPLVDGTAAPDAEAAAFSEGVRPMMSVRVGGARLLCFHSARQGAPPLGPTDYRYLEIRDGVERDAPVQSAQAQQLWQRLRAWAAASTAPPVWEERR